MSVHSQVRDGVAILTLDNPPMNRLGLATPRDLVDALERAQHDSAIRAVIISGAGRVFCGGADIREFNRPEATQPPTLPAVIAAINGLAFGGGHGAAGQFEIV